jgi:tRNA(fMet)-specific endonuclease VapC
LRRNPAQHLAALEQFLRAVIVLPFDEHAAGRYGALKANLERQGQAIGELDLQIAAVTLTHGLRLVTHNQAHFVRIPDLALDDWLAQKTS